MKSKLLYVPALLFCVTFFTTGLSVIKVYPIFTFIFSTAILLIVFETRQKLNKSTFIVSIFFMIFLFSLIIFQTFDSYLTLIKFILNFVFFVSLIIYAQKFDTKNSQYFFRLFIPMLKIFIFLNFLSVLYIIVSQNLWHLPLNLASSRDSYEITRNVTVIFGEQQKNVWAHKVSTAIIFLVSSFFIAKTKIKFLDLLIFGIGIFTLLYVNSRTAWLMLIIFFIGLNFYNHVIIKKNMSFILVITFLIVVSIDFIDSLIKSFIWFDLESFSLQLGAQGDGLMQRFIIWNRTILSIPDLEINKLIFGSGLFSFERYFGTLFSENNPHNLFLSYLLDFGIIGLLFITTLLVYIFSKSKFAFWVLMPPFLANYLVRGLGYDIDMFLYLFFALAVSSYLKNKHKHNYSKKYVYDKPFAAQNDIYRQI